MSLQEFKCGIPVDRRRVTGIENIGLNHLIAQGIIRGSQERLGRKNHAALHYSGDAALIQHGNKGLPGSQMLDRVGGIEFRVLPVGLRRGLHSLEFLRGIGVEGMLDLIAQLAHDSVRDIRRILGNEEDAHSL